MISPVVSVFSYSFMQHAFIAGTLAAILAGIVGYFVIMRNLAFAAHALGHVGFAGATGALLVGLSPILGQFIVTLLAAVGIGILGERISKSDMAIGIVLSFCLGLGTLFLHFYQGFAGQASVILFGNLLGVSTQDLKLMFILLIISLLALSVILRPLLFASLEPELAEAKGIELPKISLYFLIILSIAVLLASQVVGVILVFALLVGPAAIAIQWTKNFWLGLGMSVAISVMLVWVGICLAFLTDWPISFWICGLTFVGYLAKWSYEFF